MTVRYDELNPFEQYAADHAKVLSRDEFIGLMNRFGNGGERLMRLYAALGATGAPEFRQWQAERAQREHTAIDAALLAFESLPESGKFHLVDGKPVYDLLGLRSVQGSTINRDLLTELLEAVRDAIADNAAGFDVLVANLDADVANSSNRLNVNRRRLWLALLRFWKNDLGNDLGMRTNHYQGSADPSGPVIDFIMAASVNAVHQGQRTPQAVRDFIRRNRRKGLL